MRVSISLERLTASSRFARVFFRTAYQSRLWLDTKSVEGMDHAFLISK